MHVSTKYASLRPGKIALFITVYKLVLITLISQTFILVFRVFQIVQIKCDTDLNVVYPVIIRMALKHNDGSINYIVVSVSVFGLNVTGYSKQKIFLEVREMQVVN